MREPSPGPDRGPGSPEPRRCTLLELVQELLDEETCDATVARTASGLIQRGDVALSGNFRGCPVSVFSI